MQLRHVQQVYKGPSNIPISDHSSSQSNKENTNPSYVHTPTSTSWSFFWKHKKPVSKSSNDDDQSDDALSPISTQQKAADSQDKGKPPTKRCFYVLSGEFQNLLATALNQSLNAALE